MSEGTTLTILTGRRPNLLRKTLLSVERHDPSLVGKSKVVAFVNADDPASVKLLKDRMWVDEIIVRREKLPLSIGHAVAYLVEMAQVERGWWVHLEDDWLCLRGWYEQALEVAKIEGSKLGQVRARVWKEKGTICTSRFHMVRKTPIFWQSQGDYLLSSTAHYTFNPSLVPAQLASKIVGGRGEMDVAKKFDELGLKVAQLLPGAFRHLGDQQSLRRGAQKKRRSARGRSSRERRRSLGPPKKTVRQQKSIIKVLG